MAEIKKKLTIKATLSTEHWAPLFRSGFTLDDYDKSLEIDLHLANGVTMSCVGPELDAVAEKVWEIIKLACNKG